MSNPFTTKDPLVDIINQVMLGEKKLTDAELKKREEIVLAIKRENPDMEKSKAYAIATAQAMKEEVELDEAAPRGMSDKEYARHELGKAKKPEVKVGAKVSVTGGGSGVVQKIYDKELHNGQKRKFIHLKDNQGRDFHHRYYAHRVKVMEEIELDEAKKSTHENPLITVHKDGRLHAHLHLSTANDLHKTDVKHTQIHAGPVKVKTKYGENLKYELSKWHDVKEDFEQIDEVGNTEKGQIDLRKYKEKAKKDMGDAGEKLWYKSVTDKDIKGKWALAVQRDKRRKGIQRADARADARIKKQEVNLDEQLENFWEAYTTMFNEAEDQQQNLLLRAMAKDPSDLMKMKRAIKMGDKALTNPALRQEILKMLDQMMTLTTGDKSLLQRTRMGFQKAKTMKIPEEVEQIDERNKENAIRRKVMDASRGARYKLANKAVPDPEPEHKTAQAHNKAIGRALRNEAIGAKDKQDEGEYGYEGDMAMSQLRTIIRNCQEMMKVLDKETDMPEWVQSKITLATDYLQTANDYLMSELEEGFTHYRYSGTVNDKDYEVHIPRKHDLGDYSDHQLHRKISRENPHLHHHEVTAIVDSGGEEDSHVEVEHKGKKYKHHVYNEQEPHHIYEEVELDEADENDLSVRTLYNKYADRTANAKNTKPVEKAIKKVHGSKVLSHMKKAASANIDTKFDKEKQHFDKARKAAGNTDMIGATVGKNRSAFRNQYEEVETAPFDGGQVKPRRTDAKIRAAVSALARKARSEQKQKNKKDKK